MGEGEGEGEGRGEVGESKHVVGGGDANDLKNHN